MSILDYLCYIVMIMLYCNEIFNVPRRHAHSRKLSPEEEKAEFRLCIKCPHKICIFIHIHTLWGQNTSNHDDVINHLSTAFSCKKMKITLWDIFFCPHNAISPQNVGSELVDVPTNAVVHKHTHTHIHFLTFS